MIKDYADEKVKDRNQILDLEKKMREMSTNLARETEAKQKYMEQSSLVREVEKQRKLIESLEKERESYKQNIERLQLDLNEC